MIRLYIDLYLQIKQIIFILVIYISLFEQFYILKQIIIIYLQNHIYNQRNQNYRPPYTPCLLIPQKCKPSNKYPIKTIFKELKFSTKNLHEAEKQQAMIKYKRNSQLLAQIFSFRTPLSQSESFKTQNVITQDQLNEFKKQIDDEKIKTETECQRIKHSTALYQQKIKSVQQIKSKQELMKKIQQLKDINLYDEKHPFFVENSPFYLNPTEQQVLLVQTHPQQIIDEQQDKLNLLDLA